MTKKSFFFYNLFINKRGITIKRNPKKKNLVSIHTCCFTGHRPQKLPWGFDEDRNGCIAMKEIVKLEIQNSILNYGITHFISGMALGFDMIAAEIVLELKKNYPFITLECALPCKNQQKYWQKEQKQRYEKNLSQADKITYVSDKLYFDGCMQKRNKYMIDNSSMLIALFNGSAGGTKQTVVRAKQKKLNVLIIKI